MNAIASSFSRGIQIFLALLCFLAIMILLPAIFLGVANRWQVIFLLVSYFSFFLGTVWRAIRYGEFTKPTEDEPLKRKFGGWVLAVQFIGLLGLHWFALYNFSRFSTANVEFLEILGFFLIIASIIVNQAAVRTLGEFFDRITIKPEHRLVTDGIYSSVRHPIYLSYILLFAGFCTMLQSSVSLGLLVVVCVVWFGNRMAIEEEMLEAKFGEEYKAYQQKTKRLFPFIY